MVRERLEEEGSYVKNRRVGMWREWTDSGALLKTVIWAPALFCVYEATTRQAIGEFLLWVQGPSGRDVWETDGKGEVERAGLVAGEYEISPIAMRGRVSPIKAMLGETPTVVEIPVQRGNLGTRYRLGGPSKCARSNVGSRP